MKQIALLSTLSVALLASYGVQAADTAELKIVGAIKPTACSLTLDSLVTADFGDIPTSSLNDRTGTLLGAKSLAFSIACGSYTSFALKVSDNRADSLVSGLARMISGGSDRNAFGLGNADGKKIGAYLISFSNETSAETLALHNAISADRKAWKSLGNTYFSPSNYIGWNATGVAGDYMPSALKDLHASITVAAVVDKKSSFQGQQIRLDGSASLELFYL